MYKYNNNNGQNRLNKNIQLYCFSILLLLFVGILTSQAANSGCPDGSIIFREDFGGNNVEDPDQKGTAIPECEGYIYNDTVVDYLKEGRYSIRKKAYVGHTEWYDNICDHTHPGDPTLGYFMQIDASEKSCQFYQTTIDSICEGAELYFSLYGTSSTKRSGDSNATLRLIIEDAATWAEIDHYDIEIENQKNGVWEQFGFSVTIPSGCNSINYRIINNAIQTPNFSGNDFCLDDIEIHSFVPQPTITAKKGTTLCNGVEEILTANLSNANHLTPPLVYSWFKCTTNSYNFDDWEKVYTGQELNLTHVTDEDAGFYKVMVTSFGQPTVPNICNSLSEFHEVKVSKCGQLGNEFCQEGTILFKEDFGGNQTSDSEYKTTAIPQCTYSFGTDNPTESNGTGKYGIRKVGYNNINWFKHIYDHTYPDNPERGYFMQVDGSDTPGIFYQTEITDLCENSELVFSIWGMSSTDNTNNNASQLQSNALLKMVVEDTNGTELTSTEIELENGKGYWEQFGLKYVVPSGHNTVIYKIINNCTEHNGNDFCLDDIEVLMCSPHVKVESPDTLCEGSNYTLTADFENDGTYTEPVTFTWFKSDTASYDPTDWTAVGSGSTLTLTNISSTEKGYYRVWISNDGSSNKISKCNPASNFAEIKIKDCRICKDTTITLADTILLGSTYQKNGFDINNPILGENKDTLHLKRKGDCDSTIALNLFVYYNSSDTIHASICQNEKFTNFGFDESSTGIFTHSFSNIYGGDSLVTLVLDVQPTYNDTTKATIVEGEKYTFNGNDYMVEGSFTDSLHSVAGCDSVMTLQLTVLMGSSDTIHASICQGEAFSNFGFNESSAGKYTQNLTAKNGADSLVTLVLEVLPTYNDTTKATIVEGEKFTFNGNDYTVEGSFTDSLHSVTGCDSVMTLQLTVLMGSSDTIHASICQGEAFSNFGFNESSAGKYTQNLTAKNGTDSLVTLVLEVLPTYNDTTKATIVEGEKYTFNGNDYMVEGSFTDSLHSVTGCDSVMTLQLTVLMGSSDTIHASICQGEAFSNFGFNESSAGKYTQNLTAKNGTDSLVTLVLEVLPTYNDTTKATIVEGEKYTFNGNDYTVEGSFTDSLHSVTGCDSVMTLQLTVLMGSSDTIHASICQGEAFSNFGFNESSAGKYTQNLTAKNGTDSLVTLVLEVLPTYNDTIKATIVEGEKYTFNGNDYTVEGSFTDSLHSVTGCDSVMTLQLTVLMGSSDTIHASICQGEAFSNFGFNESSTGKYTQNLTAKNGTDSLVTLVLEVLPTYNDTIKATIVEGEKYTFNGNDYTVEGSFTDSLHSVTGCDSVMTLQLTVLMGSSDTIHASICQGEAFSNFGFNESSAGKYTQNLTAKNGTDSLVTLVLEVLPTYNDTTKATIVEGEKYTFNGNDYTVEGSFTDSLHSVAGCDSVMTLQLTVLMGSSDTIHASICQGEAFSNFGFNESSTGKYTQNLTAKNGADSLVTLVLEVLPTYNDTIKATIVEGEKYTFNGNDYMVEGSFTDSLHSVTGCDSVMTLQLTVLMGSSDTIHASICQGESFSNFGFNESSAGKYTQNLTAKNGADSLVTLVLEVLPTYNDTIKAQICQGENYDQYGFNKNHEGIYHLDLKSINGCDSTITLILTILPSYEDTLSDTICEGERYEKNGFKLPIEVAGIYYHTLNFSPISGCDSVVTLNLNVLPLHSTTHEFFIKEGEVARFNGERYKEEGEHHQYIQNSDYCEDITIIVKMKEDTISTNTFNYVAIIPDEYLIRDDGTDRRWHVENIELYPKATISIYDRWGKKLFETMEYTNETGWDGTYNGHDMPSTDYWYQIEVREIDRLYTGHFTLLR